MQLFKLDSSFYPAHTHLVQVMDKVGNVWDLKKVRGYGVAVISINTLTFGIPLRSHISHKAAYITVKNPNYKPGRPYGKGLDFSKAILISQPNYLSSEIYKIPAAEHALLVSKNFSIVQAFDRYVAKYVATHSQLVPDQNILNSLEYRHTTLQNYHVELGI